MKTLAHLALVTALFCSAAFAQRPDRAGKRDLRIADKLRVGDTAPDFKLKTDDGSREVQLSSFRGKRPVVLVFGSYT